MPIILPAALAKEIAKEQADAEVKRVADAERSRKDELFGQVRNAIILQVADPDSRRKIAAVCWVLVNRAGRFSPPLMVDVREVGRLVADVLIGGVEELT